MRRCMMLMVLLMVVSLSGCHESLDYSGYPDHFAVILESYDGTYHDREPNFESEDIYRCYHLENGQFYFITKTWGYEEDMLIGVKMTQDAVQGVDILFENESDKYGEYVTEDWFLDRFVMPIQGKFFLVKKQKIYDDEVVAITGATITSQGVLDGVNACIAIMEDVE